MFLTINLNAFGRGPIRRELRKALKKRQAAPALEAAQAKRDRKKAKRAACHASES